MMTYPEIGNYGINLSDSESDHIHGAGLVVKRLSPTFSSWRGQISLQEFLVQNNIVGIEGVDTRAITRRIREHGAMKAGITTDSIDTDKFQLRVKAHLDLHKQDLVAQVTTRTTRYFKTDDLLYPEWSIDRAVLVDFGTKENIVRSLQPFIRQLTVLPAHSPFELIASYDPQAVILSNGPGDPNTLHSAIETTRQLIASGIPTLGVCLGHQLLALACGGIVDKMRFGHHGGNHPVQDLESGVIFITSQNHSFTVRDEAFPETLKMTHVNLNDGSVEGFQHVAAPVFSVQFHPEASPGPQDAQDILLRFVQFAANHAKATPAPAAV
jgi:carbamoyl-phosphate synthase small subunit